MCSLVLVGYSAAAPGGTIPSAPANPKAIRVVTWNILVGSDHGPFWRQHGWPIRRHALKTALDGCKPDILCVQEIEAGDPTEAIILTADFNETPDSRGRRLLAADGLISSALLAGDRASAPTYQFYGIRFRSLDEILVNHGCQVLTHHVVAAKTGNTYPSDHFGVLADVLVGEPGGVD